MKIRNVFLVLFISVLVIASACAKSDTTTQTQSTEPQYLPDGTYPGLNAPFGEPGNWTYKGELVIPHVATLSGPVAASVGPVMDGMNAWFRYQNEYLGGVRGYKVSMNIIDTKMEPELFITGTNRVIDEGNPFIYSQLMYAFPAAGEVCQRRQVPYLGLSGGVAQAFLVPGSKATANYHFQTSPVVPSRMAIDLKWVAQDWTAKGQSRKPRIGTFNQDGLDGHEAATAVRVYCEKMGMEFAVHTFHPALINDAIAQVGTLKRAQVDYIITGPESDQPMSILASELQRQRTEDWQPTVIGHPNFTNTYIATKNPIYEGFLTYQYGLDGSDADKTVIQFVNKLNEMYTPPGEERAFLYYSAVQQAWLCCDIYEKAIDKYGGLEGLTGPKVRELMEEFHGVDPIGLTGAVTWTKTDHQGVPSLRLSRCEGGKVKPVTDFIEADPLTEEQMYPEYWTQD